MEQTYTLKITSAVAIDGEIHKAGSLVTVDERAALGLLRRGKAEPATNEDAPKATEPAAEAPAEAPAEPEKKPKAKPAKADEQPAEPAAE